RLPGEEHRARQWFHLLLARRYKWKLVLTEGYQTVGDSRCLIELASRIRRPLGWQWVEHHHVSTWRLVPSLSTVLVRRSKALAGLSHRGPSLRVQVESCQCLLRPLCGDESAHRFDAAPDAQNPGMLLVWVPP